MGDAREYVIIEAVVMTARIQAAHRLGRNPEKEELDAAIDHEIDASVSRGGISPDRRDAISEAAKNFAASGSTTYQEYLEEQNRLAGKSVVLAITARDRANRARAKASAEAYKELDEKEWRDAMDKAGENAGGRRKRSKRSKRGKTARQRRRRHSTLTRRTRK